MSNIVDYDSYVDPDEVYEDNPRSFEGSPLDDVREIVGESIYDEDVDDYQQ